MLAIVIAAAIAVQSNTFSLSPEARRWIDVVALERSDRVPWRSIFGPDRQSGTMDPAFPNELLPLGVCIRNHPPEKGWIIHCGGEGMDENRQPIIKPLSEAIVDELSSKLDGWKSSGWVENHDGMPGEKAEEFIFTSKGCDLIFVRRFIRSAMSSLPSNGAVQLTVWMAPNPPCAPSP